MISMIPEVPRDVWRQLSQGHVKHWHSSTRRLIATVAIYPHEDGSVDYAVARCRNTDNPTRAWGTKLATERLDRYRKYKSASESEKCRDFSVVEREIKKNLSGTFKTIAEFEAWSKSNPFEKTEVTEEGIVKAVPFCEADYLARRAHRRKKVMTMK